MARYGLFTFAVTAFAVPLVKLRKIVHQQAGYYLPKLPPIVSEVLVEEQRLIPLVSLPGLEQVENRDAEYKVLVESEAGLIAFPAGTTCGIVAGQKGTLLAREESDPVGVAGRFRYQATDYCILDIDFLALRIAQETDKVA